MSLFSKSTTSKQPAASPIKAAEKIPKPKILLLDFPNSASSALLAKGFNVTTGTLGKPYKVPKEGRFLPVIGISDTPNHTEQEIVVVDFSYGELAAEPQGEKQRPNSEKDIWAKCDKGYIDPRVRPAIHLSESFSRILKSGGVFIIFADRLTGISLVLARANTSDKTLDDQQDFKFDVWSMLKELDDLHVKNDSGNEIRGADSKNPISCALSPFLLEGSFTCTIKSKYRNDENWNPLAVNKYGDLVAVARRYEGGGHVIVLPQIKKKTELLEVLLSSTLPEICPHLFPHIEKGTWTNRPEYELTRVLEIMAQQHDVKKRASEEIARLNGELDKERAAQGWIHDLLTGTEAKLVEAVKRALSEIGFSKVVDVDVERDREGKSRREDLQITDISPTLIVDIKGVGGYPSDDDALQADKHAAIRMREQKRTDITGLSIVNHQRHLPPLERENSMPFRQELLDASEERSLGLMTAWDLYRCVRNKRKHGWSSGNMTPNFYKKGRIEVTPGHYQHIGNIAKVWSEKFGLYIDQHELRIGESIAIEFPIEFEEMQVNSIFVNEKKVEIATKGDPTGLVWQSGRPRLREGMRVFRIIPG